MISQTLRALVVPFPFFAAATTRSSLPSSSCIITNPIRPALLLLLLLLLLLRSQSSPVFGGAFAHCVQVHSIHRAMMFQNSWCGNRMIDKLLSLLLLFLFLPLPLLRTNWQLRSAGRYEGTMLMQH